MTVDIDNIPMNDPEVWKLFAEGRTKGIFQLESNLGRSWSKKVKPENMEELAALISILRPGSLKAMYQGKSMSQHYVDRKHGLEPVEYLHPSLEPFLAPTYGVLIYQEQAMIIAKELAGFSESEADVLRKAIGKKKADVMAKVKEDFIIGCEKVGTVEAKDAEEIFGWIEKSARYSFNKSITKDSVVQTPDGEKQLSEIKAGDFVLSPCLLSDQYVKVLETYDHGSLEVYELELECGKTIKCTMEHKFLCKDGVIRPLSDILLYFHEIVVQDCVDMKSSKIVRIKSLGTMPTMDIEVDSDSHLFYANKIATSNSHAVAYGLDSYWSAYFKAHYIKQFFVAYFRYAKDKQDAHQEVYELASEAKLFDLQLKTPSIANFKRQFNCVGDTIYFGIKDIKSLTGKNGDKAFIAVEDLFVHLNKKIENTSWMEILLFFSPKVNSTVFKTLGSIGFFRGIKDKVTRNKVLYDYEIFRILTKAETNWVIENYPKRRWKDLQSCFRDLAPTKKEGGGTSKESRKQIILNEIKMLQNPPYDLEDDPEWIIDQEVKFLGCPVSMSKIETTDMCGNTTCKELADGKKGKKLTIAANITRVFNTKVKKEGASKGKEMSFLTIEDETCSIDSVVVFPEAREDNKYSLFEGNNVMIYGSSEKGDGSLIVEKISDI